jgi:hypothetical protein
LVDPLEIANRLLLLSYLTIRCYDRLQLQID